MGNKSNGDVLKTQEVDMDKNGWNSHTRSEAIGMALDPSFDYAAGARLPVPVERLGAARMIRLGRREGPRFVLVPDAWRNPEIPAGLAAMR
jgi:hypothetical protein